MPENPSQLSIEALITAPLVAASKANIVMVTGQVRALLENCFNKKDGDLYEPVMIKMSLTRGFPQEGPASSGGEFVKPVTMTFLVPLLSIIPISHLVVNKVNVDFDLEITAATSREQGANIPGHNPVVDSKALLFGKVSNKTSGGSETSQSRETSHLKVNINAGPLPLPPGLLTILDLYSKSIQPSGLDPSAQPSLPKTT